MIRTPLFYANSSASFFSNLLNINDLGAAFGFDPIDKLVHFVIGDAGAGGLNAF
jgi:hypothetical protein